MGLIAYPCIISYNPVESKAIYTTSTVWAIPISLVTTKGISIDLFSSAT